MVLKDGQIVERAHIGSSLNSMVSMWADRISASEDPEAQKYDVDDG
jgi:hypothetical protein